MQGCRIASTAACLFVCNAIIPQKSVFVNTFFEFEPVFCLAMVKMHKNIDFCQKRRYKNYQKFDNIKILLDKFCEYIYNICG